MPDLILEKNVNVRYSEMDFDKSLKPYSLLNYFQDIASDNAESLGFGYSYITPKNLMWVLIKYRIEFDEYPTDNEMIILRTQPRGYNKIFAYRNFEILSGNKRLVRASSAWSLVKSNDMSIVSIDSAINSPYLSKFKQSEDDLSYSKIPIITKVDFQKEFEVRYNDIDVNHHANNGNYIVWALEPLSFDFRINHRLKTIDMVYKKEIKFGEKLISQVQFLDEITTIHTLKHSITNEDLCMLKCEWKKVTP
ncbi:hypothetical protein IJ182_11070 [bacterium]|nr:hypothetical protein [bacterium]